MRPLENIKKLIKNMTIKTNREVNGAVLNNLFAELDKNLLDAKLKKARITKKIKTGSCEGRKPYGHYPGEQETLDRILALHKKPYKGKRLTCGKIAGVLNDEKIKTRSLPYLAADHGFLNPFPHRALFDVMTMIQIAGMYDINEILKYADSPIFGSKRPLALMISN